MAPPLPPFTVEDKRPGNFLSAGVLYGCFAFVMATGIVSIAARLVGLGPVSSVLFCVNLVAFPVLAALFAVRLLCDPAVMLADLSDHRRAPRTLTTVAAACVFGNEVALASGWPGFVAGVWVGAAVLWAALVYGIFAVLTIARDKPSFESGLDGAWLLVVVATEALAILTTRAAFAIAPPQPAVFVSLCLFLLGGAFYAALLILIVYRWLFLPMRAEQVTPDYWINMGAAAISTLAGTRLLSIAGSATDVTLLRGFVFVATVSFWSLATWWIPLLTVLTVWRHRPGGVRLAYRIDNWAIVFPLGMYTTATWRLSHEIGMAFLQPVSGVFVWVALAAWVLTFTGMLRAAIRSRPLIRSTR
jgi:tellurite resistance protein TehA-like permease